MKLSDLKGKYSVVSQGTLPTSTDPTKQQEPPKTIGKTLGDTAKSVGHFLTSSEQGLGNDIASAITAPKQIQQATDAAAHDQEYLRTLITLKRKAATEGKSTEHYDTLINNFEPQGYQGPEIPSTGEVLLDAAGVAADTLSAGTYGAAKTGAMKTGGLAVKATPTVVDLGTQGVKRVGQALAEGSVNKEAAKVVDIVAPKLSAKETAEALASRGGTKSGILRTLKVNTDPAVERIANTVKEFVPDFSAKKSLIENVNATKQAVGTLANNLKERVISSGRDRIYSPNELRGVLNSIEEPISLRGTPFEKQIGPLKNAVIKIASGKEGKVSSLLDVRKEFDALVDRTYPGLYDKENAPIRAAVKGIRDALTNYTAERLPQDVGLKQSLRNQSHLLQAIENMAEKAASGNTKEAGTNALARFRAQHPDAYQALISSGLTVGIGGAALKVLENK